MTSLTLITPKGPHFQIPSHWGLQYWGLQHINFEVGGGQQASSLTEKIKLSSNH